MKVVHVSDCFLPRLGGIEIQVSELTRVQQDAGHEVEVVTATPDRQGRVEPIVPVHRLAVNLPWELPIRPWASRHLGRLFDELKPDVVHVHVGTVSPFAWSAVRQSLARNLPAVITVHSMWDPYTRGMNRALDRTTHWSTWPIVGTTVSDAAAALIRKVTEDRLPIRVIANGIEPSIWKADSRNPIGGSSTTAEDGGDASAPSAPSGPRSVSGPATGLGAGSARGPVRVVAVGRLALRKQPVGLVRILAEARARLDPAVGLQLTIAGDGPSRSGVERAIRRHAMGSWVRLAGRLDRAQVRELLDAADIFIAPAEQESFGIAALEARTAGVPIVAYATSGVADFVEHGVEGLLGRNPHDLANAVVRLAGDRDLRARIAEHNRTTEPKSCTWPAVLDGFDDCYAEARDRLSAAGRP